MKKVNDNLEVKPEDEDVTFTWAEANEVLANGWRLPTKSELNEIYKQKYSIGGFADDYYWSSSEASNYSAWVQLFNYDGVQTYRSKYLFASIRVRAVRSLK
jgi:hypothetical protein